MTKISKKDKKTKETVEVEIPKVEKKSKSGKEKKNREVSVEIPKLEKKSKSEREKKNKEVSVEIPKVEKIKKSKKEKESKKKEEPIEEVTKKIKKKKDAVEMETKEKKSKKPKEEKKSKHEVEEVKEVKDSKKRKATDGDKVAKRRKLNVELFKLDPEYSVEGQAEYFKKHLSFWAEETEENLPMEVEFLDYQDYQSAIEGEISESQTIIVLCMSGQRCVEVADLIKKPEVQCIKAFPKYTTLEKNMLMFSRPSKNRVVVGTPARIQALLDTALKMEEISTVLVDVRFRDQVHRGILSSDTRSQFFNLFKLLDPTIKFLLV